MRQIIYRPRVLIDIQEIWGWIAKDNEDAANRTEAAIYARIEELPRTPGIGRRRADVPNPGILFVTVHPYSIAYKYNETTVTIIRVLHGARDFTKHF